MRQTKESKMAYTVAEAAELISISRAFCYELINSRQIETIKIGRSRRITRNQLLAYVERKEAEA